MREKIALELVFSVADRIFKECDFVYFWYRIWQQKEDVQLTGKIILSIKTYNKIIKFHIIYTL